MAHHQTNPAALGWVYHGSNQQSKVEFWSNRQTGAKMDYYPTTGTVKTMMDHPTQGHTQMFRRNLSEAEFQAVLAKPREHTGKGYQTKANPAYAQQYWAPR